MLLVQKEEVVFTVSPIFFFCSNVSCHSDQSLSENEWMCYTVQILIACLSWPYWVIEVSTLVFRGKFLKDFHGIVWLNLNRDVDNPALLRLHNDNFSLQVSAHSCPCPLHLSQYITSVIIHLKHCILMYESENVMCVLWTGFMLTNVKREKKTWNQKKSCFL